MVNHARLLCKKLNIFALNRLSHLLPLEIQDKNSYMTASEKYL
ncbi:hypothetical protein LACWKB8_0499 [Lactobacillus sp. wkB8]|nr:hypothetical protein LACWKB8_0499 [Lactobacillus sp. wkB8]